MTRNASTRRRISAALGVLTIATFGVSQTTSAAPSDPYRYAEGTWSSSSDSGVVRSTDVRIAPGHEIVEGPAGRVLEGEIEATLCKNAKIITVSGTIAGPAVGPFQILAIEGKGSINVKAGFVGTITTVGSDAGCSGPIGDPVVEDVDTRATIVANWKNAPGSVPVKYTGGDCGGTGSCYYRDAVATASVSIPSEGIRLALGVSDEGFLFRGDYPIAP